jgi:prevent-host-death family protein
MRVIDIRDAKRRVSELLERAAAGEEIVIGKAGKPIALLGPYTSRALPKRTPGSLKGKIKILPGFDKMDKEIEGLFCAELD